MLGAAHALLTTATMTTKLSFVALVMFGCGHSSMHEPADIDIDSGAKQPDSVACDTSSLRLADSSFVLAPAFANSYATYELGNPFLTGLVWAITISPTDLDHLLVRRVAEATGMSGIYAVTLRREPCGHIVGFSGTPQLVVADTSELTYTNVAYGPSNLVFATYHTPQVDVGLAELTADQGNQLYAVALDSYGVGGDPSNSGSGLVSLGFVPTGQSDPALVVTSGTGVWHRIAYTAEQGHFAVTGASPGVALSEDVYGIGYVPPGSPGITQASVLVGEGGHVAVYGIDAAGDPIVSSRMPFYSQFGYAMRGEVFDPKTGDLLFGSVVFGDLSVVQGFAPIL